MWKLIDIICLIFGLSGHNAHGCLHPLVAFILFAMAVGMGVGIGYGVAQ